MGHLLLFFFPTDITDTAQTKATIRKKKHTMETREKRKCRLTNSLVNSSYLAGTRMRVSVCLCLHRAAAVAHRITRACGQSSNRASHGSPLQDVGGCRPPEWWAVPPYT